MSYYYYEEDYDDEVYEELFHQPKKIPGYIYKLEYNNGKETWTVEEKTDVSNFGRNYIVPNYRVANGSTELRAVYITETRDDKKIRKLLLDDIKKNVLAEIKNAECVAKKYKSDYKCFYRSEKLKRILK
jgi:hypothetical protein